MRRTRTGGFGKVIGAAVIATVAVAGLGVALFFAVLGAISGSVCGGGAQSAASASLGPPGSGEVVGASEYGGPGDPSSGTVGASGANLLLEPDSYAELGGYTFAAATAMGGLPYQTPLRITWGGHSLIAYKRDFGLGGGPVAGHPRVIDLWWELAGRLGIPYERGLWSGPVRIERPPATGAGALLGASLGGEAGATSAGDVGCPAPIAAGLPLTAGPRAQLLPNGMAAAPAGAPPAVRGIIAAGNQIVGKPYVYGAAHGLPLDEVATAYDCSSSVEHLLYGGGLLPLGFGGASSELESFGAPGPGRWVTLFANADHVFMYVAGLRWDTHNAAGAGDGTTGIGWHPLVRNADGFIARHPVGL